MERYKILLIVADGLGDRPIGELENMTPLEKAVKPNINSLLKNSQVGLMDPIGPGIVPGSDTSHLALFGLDPKVYYKGRGSFEALGSGADLKEGDVAFRGNFASVDNSFTVVDRRAGRSIEEAPELVSLLNEKIGEVEGIKVRFYRATEHRVAVVLSGDGLSEKVSDTDPHEVGKKVKESVSLEPNPYAEKTAKVVNVLTKLIFEILNNSEANIKRQAMGLPPANMILLRGASIHRELPKIQDYAGLKATAVSATALIKGVCRSIGMNVVTPKGATGGINSDLNSKAEETLHLLNTDSDMVFLHVKGTDAAAHDGKYSDKISVIERLDRALGIILDKYGSDLVIALTGDHTTSSELREHTGDAVPFMIYSPLPIISDNITNFSEREVRRGSLRIRGLDVLNLLMNYSNRASKYGA